MPGADGSRTTSWADYANQRKYTAGNTWQDAGVGFLRTAVGGPVGTGEYLYGAGKGNASEGANDALGMHIGNGTTFNYGMTEDVYNSMTPEEWDSFAHMGGQQQSDWIVKRKTDLIKAGKIQGDADAAAGAEKQKGIDYDAWRARTLQGLDDYAKKMNMSVDDLVRSGDAGVLTAQSTGQRNAGMQAYAAGSGLGGISNLNSQKAAADSMNAYQMQRSQLGLQATGMLSQGLNQQYMNEEDRRRYEQGMDLQLQGANAAASQQDYMQRQQRAGGTLGLIGAGVGAYFGGAQGAQAGYSLGSGIGQQNYSNQNPYSAYRYRYPSGTGGGGGLGGRGTGSFGNSQ